MNLENKSLYFVMLLNARAHNLLNMNSYLSSVSWLCKVENLRAINDP